MGHGRVSDAAGQSHGPGTGAGVPRLSARPPKAVVGESRWYEILDVAAHVFYEKGYEATTIQDIASRVGLLKGSLYYYIDTKEDLLYAIAEHVHADGLRYLTEDETLMRADAVTRLSRFVERWMARLATNIRYSAVVEREFRSLRPERVQTLIDQRDAYDQFVRDIIGQGVDEGAFDPAVDPAVAANSIMQLMNYTHLWYRPEGRLSFADIGDWYRTFILRGLALAPSG